MGSCIDNLQLLRVRSGWSDRLLGGWGRLLFVFLIFIRNISYLLGSFILLCEFLDISPIMVFDISSSFYFCFPYLFFMCVYFMIFLILGYIYLDKRAQYWHLINCCYLLANLLLFLCYTYFLRGSPFLNNLSFS